MNMCRFKFPFECSSKTHLEISKVNSKDGTVKYRAETVTARNDPRVNRYQRVQLQGWRANRDISAVIDYNSTCIEYLTKHASKPERLSSVVEDAFSYISSKVTVDNFDSVSVFKK